MTKKTGSVIVSIILFTFLLTGCKMPASTAPTEEVMTTPIVIQTDSPALMTQTSVAKFAATATLEALVSPTSTPEPTEVIVIPTLTRPAEYTVKEGEFPYCIARRFDVNPEDLLSINNIGGSVSPGTKLQIPQTGTWPGDTRSLKDHPTSITVSSGDTIYSIACEFGDVTPEAIIAANKLSEPYDLTPGQTLQIP